MLKILFKEACSECPIRETYVEEDRIKSDSTSVEVHTKIGCIHEQVCMFYHYDRIAEEEMTNV